MANKKKGISPQQTLFDVPAIQRHEIKQSSTKIKIVEVTDISNIGLNAIYEGRSLVYRNFSDYINNIRK